MPRSLQDILRARQRSDFVGRGQYLEDFQGNLDLAFDHSRRTYLYSIFGPAGVGKTFLLRRFQSITQAKGIRCAWVDESDSDLVSAIGRIGEHLHTCGLPCHAFLDQYRLYRQRREEIEADPEAPKGAAALLGRTLVRGAFQLAKHIPAGSVATELVDETQLSEVVGDLTSYALKKFKNSDEVGLVLRPLERLTPLLLEALRDGLATVLFVDTYERTRELLDEWLRDVIEGRYGEAPAGLTLAIAGQHGLDRSLWAPFESLLTRIRLDAFTEEEASDYLRRKGFTDEAAIASIVQMSGRLPLFIAIVAAEPTISVDEPARTSETVLDRFLRWAPSSRHRDVAIIGAVPILLNSENLTLLTEGAQDSVHMFEWLKSMPFVSHRDEGFIYHQLVRSYMLRHLRTDAPSRWSHLHSVLSAHYGQLLAALDRGRIGHTHYQQILKAAVYHQLCCDPQNHAFAVAHCLRALLNYPAASHVVISATREAGADGDVEPLVVLAKTLQALLLAVEAREYRGAREQIQCIHSLLPEDLKAGVEFMLADLAEDDGMLEEADKHATNSIGLSTRSGSAYRLRSRVRRKLQRFDDALTDIDHLEALSPNNSRISLERGIVFARMSKVPEAQEHLGKAAMAQSNRHVAYKELGKLHARLGRYPEAIEEFTRALEDSSECPECWAGLAAVLKAVYAPTESADVLLGIVPAASRLARVARTSGLLALGEHRRATEELNAAIEEDSSDGFPYEFRARASLLAGDPSAALADLNIALEIEPRALSVRRRRAACLTALERYREAIEEEQNVLLRDHANRHACLSRLSALHLALKDYASCTHFSRAALECDPTCAACWTLLTQALKQQYPLSSIERVLETIGGDGFEVTLRRADALFTAGAPQTAFRIISSAVPNGPLELKMRGDSWIEMREYEMALADYQAALNADPSVVGSNELGLLLTYMGRYEDALNVYARAEDSLSTIYNVAIATVRLRGLADASEELGRASIEAERACASPDLRGPGMYARAGLLAVRGERDAAIAALSEALDASPYSHGWASKDVAWLELRDDTLLTATLEAWLDRPLCRRVLTALRSSP